MGMEGINWEGISQEASLISQFANTFTKGLYDESRTFLDELCKVWGSGNAIKFANEFSQRIQDEANMVIKYSDALVDKLMKAVQIYPSAFNVNVTITKSEGTLAELLDHNIKDKVNGITGMDKEHVRNLINNYQSKVKDLCDDYEFDMNNISVSLYDLAGVQKEYFTKIVREEGKRIYSIVTVFTNTAKKLIEGEIDAMDAVKQSVLNAFNNY